MATLSIDPEASPRLITVASPATEVTVQEIVNWCREWEQGIEGMAWPKLINAAGKEGLGGGKFVTITAAFQNTQIEFEARGGPSYEECKITGGNLVALNDVGSDITPLSPTAFVYAIIERDTSGIIIESGVSGLTAQESTLLNLLGGIEGSYDIQEVLRVILAATAGKLSGAGTSTVKIRDTADSKDRIDATVDANGNRTAVTLDTS